MNFQNMPELHYRYGYPIALGAMALIDGYLIYRFRKAKWF
jgi:magnesium transporter